MALQQGGTLKNKKYTQPAPFPKVTPKAHMDIEKGEMPDNEASENGGMKTKKGRSNVVKSLMSKP